MKMVGITEIYLIKLVKQYMSSERNCYEKK